MKLRYLESTLTHFLQVNLPTPFCITWRMVALRLSTKQYTKVSRTVDLGPSKKQIYSKDEPHYGLRET